jgi:hypothetical protein
MGQPINFGESSSMTRFGSLNGGSDRDQGQAYVRCSKRKIVLYVGHHFGNDLFLWFNTDARQRTAQLPIAAGEAPGITHECFLDCGRVTTHSETEFEMHFGRASSAFLRKVAEEIEQRASTLTNGQCREIAAALKLPAA